MNQVILKIKHLMEKHELSAAQLADSIGVQRSTLSHIFSGRNKPSLELISKIAINLKVDLNWLILDDYAKNQIITYDKNDNLIHKSGLSDVTDSIKKELDLFTNVNNRSATQKLASFNGILKEHLEKEGDLYSSVKNADSNLNTSDKNKDITQEYILDESINKKAKDLKKNNGKLLERIVFFYQDGSFKDYISNN